MLLILWAAMHGATRFDGLHQHTRISRIVLTTDEAVAEEALPLTLGHEGIGIVEALGEGVDGIGQGDRVGVPWLHDTCLACRDCLTGHESVCARQRAHGMQVDGAFADYVVVKAAFAVPVPKGLDPVEAAPLLCAGVTAFGAVAKAALDRLSGRPGLAPVQGRLVVDFARG